MQNKVVKIKKYFCFFNCFYRRVFIGAFCVLIATSK